MPKPKAWAFFMVKIMDLVLARALVDLAGTNVKCGDFFYASQDYVDAKVKHGEADVNVKPSDVYVGDHPEFVKLFADNEPPAASLEGDVSDSDVEVKSRKKAS